MAVTRSIRWDRDAGYDVHVLRNDTWSRPLKRILVIDLDDGTSRRAENPPSDVEPERIQFKPKFLPQETPLGNTFKGPGVTVDTGTGSVKAHPNPPPTHLKNFIIEPVVTRTNPDGTRTDIGGAPIRVHVHTSVADAWLTPSSLTVRVGADGLRFSVLAQFDDGTVGDITRVGDIRWVPGAGGDFLEVGDMTQYPGHTWASSNTQVIDVNPNTGELQPKMANNNVTITATLPPSLGGKTVQGSVRVRTRWSDLPHAATLVQGPGVGVTDAKLNEVPNILFLSDGFTAADERIFDELIADLVRLLSTSQTTSPFDLLQGAINYWKAFIPSREEGTSALYDVRPFKRQNADRGEAILGESPQPPGAGTWTLQQLTYEVGLPVLADSSLTANDFNVKLAEWSTLFGSHITGPTHPNPRVNVGLFLDWIRLHDHRIVNERDTALGLALGTRPNASTDFVTAPRVVTWHPLRTTRDHLDQFIGVLLNPKSGFAVGQTWTSGKDRSLVFVLCGGARYGGARTGAPNELVTSSLVADTELRIVPVGGSRSLNLDSHAFPHTAVANLHKVSAHELAHAFHLQDEYGELLNIVSDSQAAGIVNELNVQTSRDLFISQAFPIEVSQIRWRWPRVRAAGVLSEAPISEGGNQFRIVLERMPVLPKSPPTHAFQRGQRVYLRQRSRPQIERPDHTKLRTLSGELEVEDVIGKEIKVKLVSANPIDPSDYPPGSVLIASVPAPASAAVLGDDYAELVAPIIREHIRNSQTPLTRIPCQADGPVQVPSNLPGGLPPGALAAPSSIVGLYSGGVRFHCDVYHPTGRCQMRAEHSVYPFCVVCRYILVDQFDPTQHGVIDENYSTTYAQP